MAAIKHLDQIEDIMLSKEEHNDVCEKRWEHRLKTNQWIIGLLALVIIPVVGYSIAWGYGVGSKTELNSADIKRVEFTVNELSAKIDVSYKEIQLIQKEILEQLKREK